MPAHRLRAPCLALMLQHNLIRRNALTRRHSHRYGALMWDTALVGQTTLMVWHASLITHHPRLVRRHVSLRMWDSGLVDGHAGLNLSGRHPHLVLWYDLRMRHADLLHAVHHNVLVRVRRKSVWRELRLGTGHGWVLALIRQRGRALREALRLAHHDGILWQGTLKMKKIGSND